MDSHVLVPYDGSEQSADALAAALASFPDSDVHLLHVVEPHVTMTDGLTDVGSEYDGKREVAERLLADARDAHDAGDRIETTVAVGRPVHQILAYTEAHRIDHIVMGSHGRDGAARLLLGSVAETVVRRAPVPVTVVRNQEAAGQPEHVLVPFDGSTLARRALSYALDRSGAAAVTALYVLYPASDTVPGEPGAGVGGGEVTDWKTQRQAHADEILAGAEEFAAAADREVRTEAVEGEPAEAIVEYVEDGDVDHVVLGSTGRDGLVRVLLGSVAETVVRRSPVSVTVVT